VSSNPADAPARPKVSVIIAAFASERWNDLRAAVKSSQAQTLPGVETIVVIDHNPDLLDRAKHELEDVTVVANSGSQGASGARNSGVAVARGEMVAFLDDDAVASASWLAELMPHFADPRVAGVGGKLIPLWATSRPRWFPDEFDWAVGASYRGMPEHATTVRNVWSGNMLLSRELFNAIGGFRADFGKVGNRSRPEDTDLCLRAAAARPGGAAQPYHYRVLPAPVPARGGGKGGAGRPQRSEPEHVGGTGVHPPDPARGHCPRPEGDRTRRHLGRAAEHRHRGRPLAGRGRFRDRPGDRDGSARRRAAGTDGRPPGSGRPGRGRARCEFSLTSPDTTC
jgi:glucosyl-dolichyl phosphate glucuronosyltransferase